MQAKGMGKQFSVLGSQFSVDGSWILKSVHRGEHENSRRVPQENESENSAALSILAKALNRKVAKRARSTPSTSSPFRELCAFSW
jgi:hypothetical protein